ncbi:hypothetical protein LWI29_000172 [Acer saccharum]|uniref:Uncharacterized protein n=1 Tax=Acer saccharum TaxID=4024 RepID=A0AA39SVK2_ACESA|nr:hypothetical protein LWI29_000172 [Acer saccharum]
MYGWGLGFFKRSNTLEKAQCKAEYLVKKLKDNSLLLDAPNETKESHWYGIPDVERIGRESVELRPDFNLNTIIQQSYQKANEDIWNEDNDAYSSDHSE